jgi:tRNA (guanine37-N1)-methyltransferase
MQIDIITAFPGLVKGGFEESIIRIALEKGLSQIKVHDLRDWADDKHNTLDDAPYGGGAGMIFKVGPLYRCLTEVIDGSTLSKREIILTSPRGSLVTQKEVTSLSLLEHLIIICGRYKGVDQRICQLFPIRELSIGDYILSGGEPAAVVLVDAVTRLLPGVLHDIDSAFTDSFQEGLLDCDYYTRPQDFQGYSVPEVLLTGDHKRIESWRISNREKITRERRPELYKQYVKHLRTE